MNKPKLYALRISPFCKRVFATLEHKKVAHDLVEIDITKKERPAEFNRVSPYGKVPCLEHDGRVLFESTVINEYLEEVAPEPHLMPADPGERAYARCWIKYSDSQVADLEGHMVHGVRDLDSKRTVCRQIFGNLAMLDKELSSKERFFLGPELSLVDISLAPQLWLAPIWARLINEKSWDSYAAIHAYADRLAAHPTIAKAVHDTPIQVYDGFFTAVLTQGLTVP